MNEILALSGVAQARLIRDREISSEELLRLHLERIAEINPSLNAVVELVPPQAPRIANVNPDQHLTIQEP